MESFIKRYNSDLANDFGNLLNRVSGLIGKYFDGCVPKEGQAWAPDKEIRKVADGLAKKIEELISGMRVHEAIEQVLVLIRDTNVYMEHQAPWKEAKENLERAGTILYTATEALRISAILLLPVIPAKAQTVLEILGASGTEPKWGQLKPGTKLKSHEALFPRLDAQGKIITKENK
jgi:methionyl-tRNA synthetase